MQEHTVDLMTIPFYQQMTQVFYNDRGMMKWAGMLLSEHNEYFALRIPPVRNRIPPVHGNDTTC